MTRERCGVSGAGEKYPVSVYTKKEYITPINIRKKSLCYPLNIFGGYFATTPAVGIGEVPGTRCEDPGLLSFYTWLPFIIKYSTVPSRPSTFHQ